MPTRSSSSSNVYLVRRIIVVIVAEILVTGEQRQFFVGQRNEFLAGIVRVAVIDRQLLQVLFARTASFQLRLRRAQFDVLLHDFLVVNFDLLGRVLVVPRLDDVSEDHLVRRTHGNRSELNRRFVFTD